MIVQPISVIVLVTALLVMPFAVKAMEKKLLVEKDQKTQPITCTIELDEQKSFCVSVSSPKGRVDLSIKKNYSEVLSSKSIKPLMGDRVVLLDAAYLDDSVYLVALGTNKGKIRLIYWNTKNKQHKKFIYNADTLLEREIVNLKINKEKNYITFKFYDSGTQQTMPLPLN